MRLGPRRHFPTGSRLQAAMAVEKSRRELVRLLSCRVRFSPVMLRLFSRASVVGGVEYAFLY